MHRAIVSTLGGMVFIGLLLMIGAGCKPGRPQFAMPQIHMLTGENLYKVVPFSRDEVMLLGNHGSIFTTHTGGADLSAWKPQRSGMEELLLCDASFIDRLTGWVVGIKGTMIHTTDGGENWSKQETNTEKNLFSVSFVDRQNGWAVGDFGTILHTADSGKTWEFQSKGIDKVLNSVCFVDDQHGWVVGEFGTILHTIDGGITWEEQRCEVIETKVGMESYDWKPMPALYEVHFEDVKRGWIVGMDGLILRTDDGGISWRKLQSPCDVPLYGIAIRGDKGWIVGNRGFYLVSGDGGETWKVKDGVIKTRFWLMDVAFSDEQNGWIVGAMGTVARTTDGGESWDLISGMSYDMPEYGLVDF